MGKVVEVCCGSYYDALQAQYGGAKRIAAPASDCRGELSNGARGLL